MHGAGLQAEDCVEVLAMTGGEPLVGWIVLVAVLAIAAGGMLLVRRGARGRLMVGALVLAAGLMVAPTMTAAPAHAATCDVAGAEENADIDAPVEPETPVEPEDPTEPEEPAEPIAVVASAPVVEEGCGVPPAVTLAETAGIAWSQVEDGDELTVTATALDGYVLDPAAPASWTISLAYDEMPPALSDPDAVPVPVWPLPNGDLTLTVMTMVDGVPVPWFTEAQDKGYTVTLDQFTVIEDGYGVSDPSIAPAFDWHYVTTGPFTVPASISEDGVVTPANGWRELKRQELVNMWAQTWGVTPEEANDHVVRAEVTTFEFPLAATATQGVCSQVVTPTITGWYNFGGGGGGG